MSERSDADWLADIERQVGLPIGPSTDWYRAVTGEQYVTMTTGGVKIEGEEIRVYTTTPHTAWMLYLRDLLDHAKAKHQGNKGGWTLYWRTRPELNADTFMAPDMSATVERRWIETKLYYVWSRLLVSNREAQEQVA